MGNYNTNSGYGNFMGDRLMGNTPAAVVNGSGAYPTGGKVLMVCPSAHPNFQVFQQMFGPDPDGANHFFTTLSAALLACTANRGDVIYVAEGYTETITGAWGGVPIAGVRVIGLGDGANRPTFTFTTAITANIPVAVANFTFQNVIFTVGFDAITALVTVTGADCAFLDCDFNTNNGTMGVVAGLATAATADRLKVVGCRFIGPATNSGTTSTASIKHEAGVDYQIVNNYFTGKLTQAIVNVATVLRGIIKDNIFVIATGTAGITMAAASTPFIVNNRFNVASGTTPIVAAAGFVAGNVYSAAAGVTSTGGTSAAAAVSTL